MAKKIGYNLNIVFKKCTIKYLSVYTISKLFRNRSLEFLIYSWNSECIYLNSHYINNYVTHFQICKKNFVSVSLTDEFKNAHSYKSSLSKSYQRSIYGDWNHIIMCGNSETDKSLTYCPYAINSDYVR